MILEYAYTKRDLSGLRRFVHNSSLGGISRVRIDADVRNEKLSIDQWIAHIGENGLSKFVTGSDYEYRRARTKKDKNPRAGDNGWDLLDFPVDVKTSNARFNQLKLVDYHLVVPPKEYHNVIYILGLVTKKESRAILHLMGWTHKFKLKSYWNHSFVRFPDRYAMPATKLYSMKSCKAAILKLKQHLNAITS